MPSPSVLLVAPDADALVEEVERAHPGLDLTAAASDTAARAYLGATAFDTVVVAAALPAPTAETLGALAASLGRPVQVLGDAPADGLADWLRERLALDAAEAAPAARGEQQEVLRSVRDELARIAHALNNPLAVIDGNAQLALELARALGTDASVVSAIEDIQGGSRELAALFSELTGLRARVERALGLPVG